MLVIPTHGSFNYVLGIGWTALSQSMRLANSVSKDLLLCHVVELAVTNIPQNTSTASNAQPDENHGREQHRISSIADIIVRLTQLQVHCTLANQVNIDSQRQ